MSLETKLLESLSFLSLNGLFVDLSQNQPAMAL